MVLLSVGQLAEHERADGQLYQGAVLGRGYLAERSVHAIEPIESAVAIALGLGLEACRGQHVLASPLGHQALGLQSTKPGIDSRFRMRSQQVADGLRLGGEKLEDGPFGGGCLAHGRRANGGQAPLGESKSPMSGLNLDFG